MSDAGPMLEVSALVRRYGAVTALGGVSLHVSRGEMFGLIGPDGAGKTTTLRVVLGLLPPHGGTVRVCGLDPWTSLRDLARRVGYLSQRFSLYGDLTVDENIAFFAELHDVRRYRARRDQLLEMVRMTPFKNRLADRLSGGMRQKLALACTLVHTPELLVLDEPTTGVDPVSRRDFWKLLSGLQRDGLTIVLATPYLDEAERCQRVALLHEGRLLATAPPRQLQQALPGSLVELHVSPRDAAAAELRRRPGVREVETFGERLHVRLEGSAAEAPRRLDALLAGLASQGMEVGPHRFVTPSLEDVFIAAIRAAEAPS